MFKNLDKLEPADQKKKKGQSGFSWGSNIQIPEVEDIPEEEEEEQEEEDESSCRCW